MKKAGSLFSAFLSLQFIVLSLFAVQQQVTPVDYVRPRLILTNQDGSFSLRLPVRFGWSV